MTTYKVPYTFIPGTKAKASEVNANFNTIINLMENLNTNAANIDLSNLTENAKKTIKENAGASHYIGEIVTSIVPIKDASLHLLDGSILYGGGIYNNFFEYIVQLKETNSNLFTDETTWQQSITDYGVCGKFVYDKNTNSVRLPKITGIIEGTTEINDLGNLTEAGLPSIEHTHTVAYNTSSFDGNKYTKAEPTNFTEYANYSKTTTSTNSDLDKVYGNSETVQPQTIKVLYYITVATGSKTDCEINIDNIATDINGKADTDLTNITNTAQQMIAKNALPSSKKVQLTLGATNSKYTAPSDGWFFIHKVAAQAGEYIQLHNTNSGIIDFNNASGTYGLTCCVSATKGDTVILSYTSNGNLLNFYFIYSKGAESEAL